MEKKSSDKKKEKKVSSDKPSSKASSDKKEKKSSSSDKKEKKSSGSGSGSGSGSSHRVSTSSSKDNNRASGSGERRNSRASSDKAPTRSSSSDSKKEKKVSASSSDKKEKKASSKDSKKDKKGDAAVATSAAAAAPAPTPEKKKKSDKKDKKESGGGEHGGAGAGAVHGGGHGGHGGEVTKTLHIATEFHSYIIGKGGAVVKGIREKTGANVRMTGGGSDEVVISGPDQGAVDKGEKEVNKIVKARQGELQSGDKMYAGKHKAADKHAQKRAEYFKQAEEAHAAGDLDKAKKLRERAKAEGAAMEAANHKASDDIFKKKNDKDITRIDLHGLQVAEALGQLEKRITKFRAAKPGEQLNVITGAGIHSGTGGAKIKPAVEEYLKEKSLPYTVGNTGTFVVTIN